MAQTDAEKCAKICTFAVDEDTSACWVLGAVPTNLGSDLIYWKSANQTCLDSIGIKAGALPLFQLKAMFPTVDGANGKPAAYVSFLKNGDNTVAKGLKIGWPAFFNAQGQLLPTVTVNGTTTDCAKYDCWEQFKAFVVSGDDNVKHLQEDGVTLWNTYRKDQELQQVTARINICAAAIGSESTDTDRQAKIAKCPELKAQIVELSKTLLANAKVDGAVQCSSYGIGPGTRTCTGATNAPGSPTTASAAVPSTSAAPATTANANAGKCAKICTFAVGEDTSACYVLGAVPTNLGSDLIFWQGADQTCLDSIGIKAGALPLSQLKSMFPTIDGANGNANAYASFLKNGDNTVAKGLKIGWPTFFNDQGQMKPTITVNGTETDCAKSDCWAQFKVFIVSGADNMKHMQEDGVTLWNSYRKDQELQQSTARINICAAAIGSESTDTDRQAQIAKCSNLKNQVVELSKTLLANAKVDGAVQCSSYGLGPGTRTCSDGGAPDSTGVDRNLDSASSVTFASLALMVAIAAQI